MTLAWLGSDGYNVTFDGSTGVTVLRGVLGVEAPPIEMTQAPWTSYDGATVVKERKGVRRLVLPLWVEEQTPGDGCRAVFAPLLRSMVKGGAIRSNSEASQRDLLYVRYESGAEQGARLLDPTQLETETFPVSLLAFDPWWYDPQQSTPIDTSVEVDFDDEDTTFDDTTGFDGSSETEITVDGDATALPAWSITGPFTTLLIGVQGGQSFQLAGPLLSGHNLVVDTRPGNRGPRLNGGPIDWSLLTPDSRLWELPVGAPVITAGATGSDGDSSVSVLFRQRWLTP